MTLEITAMKDQAKANKDTIEANKNNFNANFAIARKYLIKALTGEKRDAVNTIIKTKDTAMKALQTETNALVKSGTVDRSGYITKASDIITSFRTNLLPYVAADQTTAFDTFIQEKINLMITNVGIRQTNANLKMQIDSKKVSFKTRLEGKKTEYKDAVQKIKDTKAAKKAAKKTTTKVSQ